MVDAPKKGRRIDMNVVSALMEKLAEEKQSEEIQFYWHGGEPLLNGVGFFEAAVEQQKAAGIKAVNLLQTNGVSLDLEWVEFFCKMDFGVGVSLDGPREVHDRFRRDHAGNGSFLRVMSAIRLMQQHGIDPICYSVVQEQSSGAELIDFFYEEGFRRIDLILPMENHNSRKIETSIALGNVLVDAYRRWLSIGDKKFYVKKFETLREIVEGKRSSCCMTRDNCTGIITIEPNGDVCLCDDLKPTGPSYKLDKNILVHSIKEISSAIHDRFKRDTINREQNPKQRMDILRNWCPATRWKNDSKFASASTDFVPLAMLYTEVQQATKRLDFTD